eukprot:1460081-Pleurochrysis_carterae.AAC.1
MAAARRLEARQARGPAQAPTSNSSTNIQGQHEGCTSLILFNSDATDEDQHGRQRQRRGREPYLSYAVREVSVNACDTIWMRKLPAASTFNKAAAGQAAAEITALKRQLKGVKAELQQSKASFMREMHIHVRDSVCKALPVAVSLEAQLSERNATVAKLEKKILAAEKMDIISKRRFANVSNNLNNSTAELRSVETELKERKKTLKTLEAEMQAVQDKSLVKRQAR